MVAVTAQATRLKYGTYSIVDTASSKVLDFSLVQVTEVKNSNAMELEGLKRCLDHLQQERVAIAKLATDRHVASQSTHEKRAAAHQTQLRCLAFSKVWFRRSCQKRRKQSHVQH